MNIPDAATLRKAIAITAKIERLQEELRDLFTVNSSTKNNLQKKKLLTTSKNSSRRGRPPKSKMSHSLLIEKGIGRKKAAIGAKKNLSPLKGKPRASSPSGPLGPAVLKALEENGLPMKVAEIFEALGKNNYQWTAHKPLQTLYIRMPKLKGLLRTEDGKYALSGIPIIPAKRGRKAKSQIAIEEKILPNMNSLAANESETSSIEESAEEICQVMSS